ncbi:hypothetical protein SLA2020_138850 [Shorea laevis]
MAQHDDHLSVTLTIVGAKVEPQITCPVSSTILALKQRLYTLLGVDVARQTLIFDAEELLDDHQIKDYNIQQFSEVALFVAPYPNDDKFTIQVMSSADCSENIKVRERMSAAELKEKVERRFGRGECTALTRLGMVMEDKDPLSAYYVNPNSLVEVNFNIDPR